MITVLLEKAENSALAKELCRILESFGGVVLITEKSICDFYDFKPDFLLFHSDLPQNLETEYTVYLQSTPGKNPNFNSPHPVYTVESFVPKHPKAENTVSIGANPLCDISMASNSEGDLQISVQNRIKTIYRNDIFPCEFSLHCESSYSTSSLLLAFAVLLLCEKIGSSNLKLCIK